MWPGTSDRDEGIPTSIPMAICSLKEGGVSSKAILTTQRYFGSSGPDFMYTTASCSTQFYVLVLLSVTLDIVFDSTGDFIFVYVFVCVVVSISSLLPALLFVSTVFVFVSEGSTSLDNMS